MRSPAHVCALALLVSLISLCSRPADAQLTEEDSPGLRVVYIDGTESYLVPHATRTTLNSLAFQKKLFGFNPTGDLTVLLLDLSDSGNAGASSVPHDLVRVQIAPLGFTFETLAANERLNTIMNHELVHVATMDQAAGRDRAFRRLFAGKVLPVSEQPESILYFYLTSPRVAAPRWYHEGIAVFVDTWMAGGLGRAQSGYDEMVFRAMVRDGAHFFDPLGLVSRGTRIDFQVGVNAYLYGTRFMTWLALAHGPEKVVAWLKRDEGSRRYYADQFRQVFGLELDRAWQDWIAFEREFQARNLAEVRKYPVTPFHTLLPRAVGSVSRTFYDDATGVLYGAFRYPGVLEHVGALDTRTGEMRRLHDIKGAMLYKVTSLAWDPDRRTLFYTSDNYAMRDVRTLDARTGEERLLLEDARIGEIVFDRVDRSLYGVRHAGGLATLVHVPYPYAEWTQVHTFPYGVVPYDLDVSPDGRLLSASTSEVNGDQFLRVWDLEKLRAGDATPLSEFRFGQSVPESFVFSPDGKGLYGSSYYTGVSNVFRYEVATGKIEAASNAESGFFRPMPMLDGKLVVFHYTGEGFVPAVIEPKPLEDVSAIRFLGAELAARHPLVKTWQVPPPSKADPEAVAPVARGPYLPLRNLGLRGAYPVLQGYKGAAGVGYHLDLEDPLRLGAIGITAAWSVDPGLPERERGHADLEYRYLAWHAGLSWNRSNFYDLFGPTLRSRKGWAAWLGWDHPFVYDPPRRLDLKTEVAFYDQLDALPNYQNVNAPFDRLITATAALRYALLRRSLGAVDDEKGVTWELALDATRAHGDVIPQGRAGLDLGVPLPLPHASLWSRSAAGASGGDPGDPFANFFFGGFGNNYVDAGEIQRYREHDAFPGFALNEIGGHTFARQMVEAKLPPLVLEAAGTPAFHLTWLRLSLFGAALWTDLERTERRRRHFSAGGQLDLRFMLLHWYEMTLSAGYAVGFDASGRASDGWMASLKVM
jgi:hypothetical protein